MLDISPALLVWLVPIAVLVLGGVFCGAVILRSAISSRLHDLHGDGHGSFMLRATPKEREKFLGDPGNAGKVDHASLKSYFVVHNWEINKEYKQESKEVAWKQSKKQEEQTSKGNRIIPYKNRAK